MRKRLGGETTEVRFVFKMMNFVLKMMNFAFKMMNWPPGERIQAGAGRGQFSMEES